MEGLIGSHKGMLYDGQIRTLSNGYEAILYRSVFGWDGPKAWLIFKLGNRLDCLYQTSALIFAEAWALNHPPEDE